MTPAQKSPKILLIQQDDAIRNALDRLLHAADYRCQVVSSLAGVHDLLDVESFDLVIIGSELDLSAQILEMRKSLEIYLPVVVICDQIDDALLDRFERLGVEAYITLPVNDRLLMRKIESSLELRQLHRQEIALRKQLQAYQQHLVMEQEVAARIFDKVLKQHFLETDAVTAVMSPMALFNGDLLLVSRTPDNRLHLMLGDFTGHGLAASIAATPTAEIFYGMTQKGFAITDIVNEINGKLCRMLPVNMFLAATAVALYPDSKVLTAITCGLPEHYLVNQHDGSWQTVLSRNIPLGIQEGFKFEEQNFSVDAVHHFYLFTDGVFEAENVTGEPFGSSGVVRAICGSENKGITRLQAELAEHTQGVGQQDDMAIVKLTCDVKNVSWRDTGSQSANRKLKPTNWSQSMMFDIDTLRVVNPVPVMVNALMDIQGLQGHRQAIFIIVSELFANALDHGLLGLSSSLKSSPEGFMEYYQQRDERLQKCGQGRIRFSFAHQATSAGGRLTIKVMDTGAGFDWQLRSQDSTQNLSFCGRGLHLVRELCSSLRFHGKGNRVTAAFEWQ